jgi:hypothetical protein
MAQDAKRRRIVHWIADNGERVELSEPTMPPLWQGEARTARLSGRQPALTPSALPFMSACAAGDRRSKQRRHCEPERKEFLHLAISIAAAESHRASCSRSWSSSPPMPLASSCTTAAMSGAASSDRRLVPCRSI